MSSTASLASNNMKIKPLQLFLYSALLLLGGFAIVFRGHSLLYQQNYKPVLIVHGALTDYTSMHELAKRIKKVTGLI